MNTNNIMIVLLSAATLANCQERHPAKFTVQVKDDAGKPLPNYVVQIGTFSRWEPGEGFGNDIWEGEKKSTDAMGKALFNHKSLSGEFGVNMRSGLPDGYYDTTLPNHKFQRVENGRWVPDNPLIEVVLKRKLNPIPMFAANLTTEGGGMLKLKEPNRENPYDLEAADWVAPEGNGKHRDVIFSYTMTKEANGDYHRVIRVSFPGKGDGLIAFDQNRWQGSELASAHTAPDSGYVPVVERTRTQKGEVITDEAKPDRNYYFRVRTKLDADGKVVSAHYGKIYGDFMSFIYYFNPTPSDRNVEYDPKRNLFVPDKKLFYQWPRQYQVTRP